MTGLEFAILDGVLDRKLHLWKNYWDMNKVKNLIN